MISSVKKIPVNLADKEMVIIKQSNLYYLNKEKTDYQTVSLKHLLEVTREPNGNLQLAFEIPGVEKYSDQVCHQSIDCSAISEEKVNEYFNLCNDYLKNKRKKVLYSNEFTIRRRTNGTV